MNKFMQNQRNFDIQLKYISFFYDIFSKCFSQKKQEVYYSIYLTYFLCYQYSDLTSGNIIIKMQSQTKLDSAHNSSKMEDETSFFTQFHSFLRQPMRRFNRSNTNSRSKSRQDQKQQTSTRFFIKSICSQTNINPEKNTQEQHKLMKILDKAIKREDTPVKSKKTIKDVTNDDSHLDQGVEKEMEWLKLERRCQLTEAENLKLFKLNRQMQEKLNVLQGQLSEVIHQKLHFEEKLRHYEQKDQKDGRQSGNNLQRLKREILKQKDIDCTPPVQMIQQQLQMAQKEIHVLRDSLSLSQRLRKQAEEQAHSHRSERETFLQDLVQQLKLEMSEKDELVEKIKIQLNIFKIRQAKQEDKVELLKNEELQTLKRKYGNVLKKYHETAQELAAYKRKEQRMNFILSTPSRSTLRIVQNSLSLSP